MIGDKDHFTAAQVAHLLAMSEKSVLRAIRRGELAAFRYSKRILLVERADIDAFRLAQPMAPLVVEAPERVRRSPKEVAADCGITARMVERALRLGFLRYQRLGPRRIIISATDFYAWRKMCRAAAVSAVERGTCPARVPSVRPAHIMSGPRG
jgi:hypothetical protein